MMEKQGREIAEKERASKRDERMARNEKVKEYWMRKQMEAQVEAVRGQITNLNLSNDWPHVELQDHE